MPVRSRLREFQKVALSEAGAVDSLLTIDVSAARFVCNVATLAFKVVTSVFEVATSVEN